MYRSILALMVLGFACLVLPTRAADEKYPDISIAQLKTGMAGKSVTIIDANGTDSYREGHIPGAINFEADSSKLDELLPKDKNALIVAYCGGPLCMAYKAAAAKVAEMGYTNIKHLPAGISGWKSAGEKTDSEK